MSQNIEKPTGGYTRRQVMRRGALGAGAALGLPSILAACGSSSSSSASTGRSAAGGSITIGSFQDPSMVPFHQVMLPKFTKETGIQAHYNETSYNAWY
ncbi:MAG: hypothetical protein ACTHNU_06300, partial [Gaiellales bacterium]